MTRHDLDQHMQRTFQRCLEISRAKSRDYAGDDNPFQNFALVEFLGLCSIETGILVRMSDKMSRISTLIGSTAPTVKDESIEDTIHDLINYAAILLAYLESRKDQQAGN